MKRSLFLVLTLSLSLMAQEPTDTSASVATDSTPTIDTVETTLATDTTVNEPMNLPKPTGMIIDGPEDSMSVTINGEESGFTPLQVTEIDPGAYTVILRKRGFYGKQLQVDVIQDSLVEVNVELRAPATLTVITEPDSALIFLNRQKTEKSPHSITPLRPNSYSVMLLRGGYAQFDTTIELSSGANDTLFVELESLMTETTTDNNTISDTSKVVVENSIDADSEDSQADSGNKKRFVIIASAIFAAFLSVIFVSEFSREEM